MQDPSWSDWLAIKRIASYLKRKPRLVYKYQWQQTPEELIAHSDTNWAGCIKTKKSTSAGGIVYGGHLVRSWSKTQAGIALSSAEAELAGIVRTTAEIIGFAGMMRDLGRVVRGKGFI